MISVVVDELRNTAELCCQLAVDFRRDSHLSGSLHALGSDLMERAADLDRDFDHRGMPDNRADLSTAA
jgi:hypothetical protein